MSIPIQTKKPVQVNAKTLKLYLKVRDGFNASLHDEEGNEMAYQEYGYVPGFMPGEHYGDYVLLDIDVETGQIVNWIPPLAEQLEEWIEAITEDKNV